MNAMPFIPAPNIVMVEIRAIFALQRIENRIMVQVPGAVTPAVVGDIADVVWEWATTSYAPTLPSAVAITEVVATDISVDTGSQVTRTTGAVNGGNGSGAMPNETTICASLRSTSRGRSARGRLFWLGISRGDMATNNNIEPTVAVLFKACLESLKVQIADGGWDWVIVSFRHAGVVRPSGPVYFPVDQIIFTDLTVDSMRRRKPGVGS